MSEYDDMARVLGDAAELLPDAPDRLAGVHRKRSRLVRRRGAAALSLLALTGAGVALGTTGHRGTAPHVVTPVTEGRVGDVTASGEVVKVGSGPVKFCTPVLHTLMLVTPRPAPSYCDLGVEARGVDMDKISDRFELDGAISGRTELTGYLEGDVLVVTKQTTPSNEPAQPGFTAPPCATPKGGWPAIPPGGNPNTTALTDYRNSHPDVIAEVAIARPTNTTYGLYALTYGDPQVVYDALGPTYGDKLCVARSRWTRAQLQGAVTEFRDHSDELRRLGVYMWLDRGELQPDGQLVVTASAARSTPDLEAIVARHPRGLIRIDYWLHPVS
jgi:hypothetical protein